MWHRNRLKSLKTDSEMASRRLAIVKGPASRAPDCQVESGGIERSRYRGGIVRDGGRLLA